MFDGTISKRYVSDYQRRHANIKVVMQHHGLVLDERQGLKEDRNTFNLLYEGKLKDPSRDLFRVQKQLEHVWLVKGYRIETIEESRTNPDTEPIEALIGEYSGWPNPVFLGRHNGHEWMDDPNYRLPYSEPE